MSSCTPCHDGLLHQNHKIQTTWLYNTHGCAFQNLNSHGVLHAISYVRDNLPWYKFERNSCKKTLNEDEKKKKGSLMNVDVDR